jgi:solute carrier family 35 (UDP-xylose/UDP-N-acetylglucosamine transporter), member B4
LAGIAMLTTSCLLYAVLGMAQERAYRKYGPCWQEGVFYTVGISREERDSSLTLCISLIKHFLSLPFFLFLIPDIKQGLYSLSRTSSTSSYTSYLIMASNLLSQLVCVSSVNRLTSVCLLPSALLMLFPTEILTKQQVSSVSTNLVLTARKAISLCFSVWYFGSSWNTQLGVGAGMVFVGSFLFTQRPEGWIEDSDKKK